MLPLGPLPATPGASSTASFSVRPTGRRSSASFLKSLAIVAVGTISGERPVTVIDSASAATCSVTSSVLVSAIFTETFVRFTVWKP